MISWLRHHASKFTSHMIIRNLHQENVNCLIIDGSFSFIIESRNVYWSLYFTYIYSWNYLYQSYTFIYVVWILVSFWWSKRSLYELIVIVVILLNWNNYLLEYLHEVLHDIIILVQGHKLFKCTIFIVDMDSWLRILFKRTLWKYNHMK